MISHPTYILEAIIQKETIAICLYAQGSTIHQYEEIHVVLEEVHSHCIEVIALLNKANDLGGFNQGAGSELKKVGQVLYDQLLTDIIKTKLKKAEIENLLILIDEGLVQIPWELLYDGQNFLCLKFNMGRSVKTRQVSHNAEERKHEFPLKMLILADPKSDLKAAREEAGIIQKELDKKRQFINVSKKVTNIDTQFVRRNIRDYDILHFAGHSIYDVKAPENSGWELSDGLLTARDVMSMGATSPLPFLVFSNACQSAQTEAWCVEQGFEEKVFGLANAFLLSGVRHYIGASWKIPDTMSLCAAKEFYLQISKGECVGKALRKMRLKLINDFGESAFVWASYVYYGDPTIVLVSKSSSKKIGSWIKTLSKKRIVIVTCVLMLVCLSGIGLYKAIRMLPTTNFNAYQEFNKTWQMFVSGKNQEIVEICKKVLDKDPNYLDAYKRLGNVYDRMGQRDDALKAYFEYAKRSEAKSDKKNLANALINIGWIYHEKGQYSEALEYYQRGLKIAEETGNELYRAKAYRQMSLWYREKSDYDKALQYLYQSTDINRQNMKEYNHKYDLACDYYHIGLIFADKEDWNSAKEYLVKSKNIFEKLKSRFGESIYFSNMGELYFYNKEFSKAEENYKKSLALDKSLGDKWGVSVDLVLLAQLYIETGRYDEALEYLQKSTAIKEDLRDILGLAENYYEAGLLYKKLENKSLSKDAFTLSAKLYKEIGSPDAVDPEEELKRLFI